MQKVRRLFSAFLIPLLLVCLFSLPVSAAAALASPSGVVLTLDGRPVQLPAYHIDGSNYFRLRDLAYLLKDTQARFSVDWDEKEQTIRMQTGGDYLPLGDETASASFAYSYTPSAVKVVLDGAPTDFRGYIIDNSNYFKLRDIMSALDVSVSWDGASQTVALDTGAPYVPDVPAPDAGQTVLSMEEIARLAASVVLVQAYDKEGTELGQGSGFFVRSDGWIASCFHVLDFVDIAKIEITTDDGDTYLVSSILAYNPGTDLALLKVNGIANAAPLPLGDSAPLVRGQRVAVIASPFAMKNTVADGIISGFRDNLELRDEGRIDIQITTPVSSGSSGGAMFDLFGNVIGIIYAKHLRAENANFSIPVNDLKELFDEVRPMNLITFRAAVSEHARQKAEEAAKEQTAAASAASASFGVLD